MERIHELAVTGGNIAHAWHIWAAHEAVHDEMFHENMPEELIGFV
jgi:hypothetical protein